jgi:hypothetical protein
MDNLLLTREQHGDVYALNLPDGQTIPWKPLTVGEYLKYERLLQSGRYPPAFIEDEIFCKCVLNTALTNNIDKLKAGLVSTVTTMIMGFSGPQSVDELTNALEHSRVEVSGVLHDMTSFICQAFPAYKPEDLYTMEFESFMLRLAQAERKLLNTGMIEKPLEFSIPGQGPPPPSRGMRPSPPPPQRTVSPQDMAREYKKQANPEKTIITKAEMQEHEACYTGHEKEDKILLQHQMAKETTGIYSDYQKQVEEGKKVEIKSVEERVAAAKKRADRNKKAYIEFEKKKGSKETGRS